MNCDSCTGVLRYNHIHRYQRMYSLCLLPLRKLSLGLGITIAYWDKTGTVDEQNTEVINDASSECATEINNVVYQ